MSAERSTDARAEAALRGLPAVHALADAPALDAARERAGRALLVDALRATLDELRAEIRAGAPAPGEAEIAARAEARLRAWLAPRPRPVINATGVLLHTNLGRAPVSRAAAAAMAAAAAGYSDLEYDLAAGRRGSRHDQLAEPLRRLTGAEAALVVNNNAGATLLVLAALAAGRGVVVSRGQLVEIGGGYRIPEVMEAGGARLVAVGTTNRTHPRDYARALDGDEDVALLLRVHTSNYRVVGFTAEVGLDELVALGRARGLPVVDDLGSGSLLDASAHGLAAEPMVPASLSAGADLVTFSGDKLLGGPQAGLIVGRADLVARLRAHPLTRALRPDKATLAGLAATLGHYLRGEAEREVPVWRMIAAPPEALAARAAAWRDALAEEAEAGRAVPTLQEGASTVGGGSLPGETLPSTLLALETAQPDALATALRGVEGPAARPVVARVAEGRVLLDPRTVLPEEDEAVVAGLRMALATRATRGG